MIKYFTLKALDFFDYFHKKKLIKFLVEKKLLKMRYFFDIGAHHGESIRLFTQYFQIKNIISFEASPLNYDRLKKNINNINSNSNDSKIILERYAIGSKKQSIYLNQSLESSSSTINKINFQSKYYKRKNKFLGSKEKFFKKIKVKMITLDDYIIENNIKRIDFLKIDTEGYEFEILKGLKQNIFKVKLILFEHHYDDMIKKNYTFSEIHNLLVDNNFKQILKTKMPFRKTFEYIYTNNRKLN